jgi:NAD(P)-dependent dehydrogenase (short-subunit alcohol dehydrogenase family)
MGVGRLTNKIAVIAGGTSGIGQFIKEGATVAVTGAVRGPSVTLQKRLARMVS